MKGQQTANGVMNNAYYSTVNKRVCYLLNYKLDYDLVFVLPIGRLTNNKIDNERQLQKNRNILILITIASYEQSNCRLKCYGLRM